MVGRGKKFVKIQIRSHLGGRVLGSGADGWMIFHKERGLWKKIKTKGVTLFFMYYFDGASLDDGEHIQCLLEDARWCAEYFFRVRASQDFLFYTFTPAKR